MNILLVNPYITDFTAFDLWLRPLGLLYLGGILKGFSSAEIHWLDTLDRFQPDAFSVGDPASKQARKNGSGKFHREFIEKKGLFASAPRHYSRYGMPEEAFQKRLDELPEIQVILMTSLMTYWVDGVRFTLEKLKQRFPRAITVLGGILPTLASREVLENHGVFAHHLIKGPGESQILPLLQDLGLKIRRFPDFNDIDALPYPAVELTGNPQILPLLTSRGCPLHCSYCASDLLNPSFRERRADLVIGELEYYRDAHDPRHFAIFDDALLINKRNHFFPIFSWARDHMQVNFHTPNGLHAREIDGETAELFYSSGFKTLRLSFESTSKSILSRSSGKVNRRQMVTAVENLEAAGYKRKEIGVYLLFGVPGQTAAEVEMALDFTGDLGVTPHLSYYSPVPGSRDFLDLQKKGILSAPVNLYETNKLYFVYRKTGFSEEQIQSVKNRTAVLGAG